MISLTQARQYLDSSVGASLPDFLVSAVLEEVEALEPAMFDAGYSEAAITQMQCLAVALRAIGGDVRRINSQGAASGASRSFKYRADGADLTAMRRQLEGLDTAGITAALIGADPNANTLLLVV